RRSRRGLAEQRLVPLEAARHIMHSDDRPRAFHSVLLRLTRHKISDRARERVAAIWTNKLRESYASERGAIRCIAWLGLGHFIPSNLVREKVDSGVPARGKLQFPLPPPRRSTRPCTGRSRRHLTKRSHRCQRVHIVPPLHDLSALDGNDRDEPVVV